MTEQGLADTGVTSQSTSNTEPSMPVSSNVSSDEPSERMIPQRKVDEIVGRTKHEAYEKAKREFSGVQQQQPQPNIQQTQQSMGGIPQMSNDDFNRLVDQRLAQKVQEHAANQFVSNFVSKMESGKSKYSDFDQSVGKITLANIPEVIQMANATDNTADVMYDLSKNLPNLVKLQELHRISPQAAYEEMQRLSASIKQNEAAAKQKSANEPLSQINHSTTGTDNGSLSGVRDFRTADWLRA